MPVDGILQEQGISCPYCGEPFTILVDGSVPDQDDPEDCQVCCQPMVVSTRLVGTGACAVEVRREDDA